MHGKIVELQSEDTELVNIKNTIITIEKLTDQRKSLIDHF